MLRAVFQLYEVRVELTKEQIEILVKFGAKSFNDVPQEELRSYCQILQNQAWRE